jgi:hypothetical protein
VRGQKPGPFCHAARPAPARRRKPVNLRRQVRICLTILTTGPQPPSPIPACRPSPPMRNALGSRLQRLCSSTAPRVRRVTTISFGAVSPCRSPSTSEQGRSWGWRHADALRSRARCLAINRYLPLKAALSRKRIKEMQSGKSAPRMMRAAEYHQYGPPIVLKISSVEAPEIARDEVLVRVHASSINPIDTIVRRGTLSFQTGKIIFQNEPALTSREKLSRSIVIRRISRLVIAFGA